VAGLALARIQASGLTTAIHERLREAGAQKGRSADRGGADFSETSELPLAGRPPGLDCRATAPDIGAMVRMLGGRNERERQRFIGRPLQVAAGKSAVAEP